MSDIFRWLNDQLSGKELFIRFTARACRKLLPMYVFSYFPFGFEDRICDLIVLVPDHCLSFYFRREAACIFGLYVTILYIWTEVVQYIYTSI